MRTFDLTPLYRSAIGFDRLANLLESQRADAQPSYPPYNIELVSEDKYRIVMALAGFDRSEVEIIADLKKKGMQVIETVDSGPFRKVVLDPVKKAFVEKNGPEVLNAIDAARK